MKCGLCKKDIATKKDKYVHVEDFNKGKKEAEIWCHFECYKKGMNRELTELEKRAEEMLGKASRIFDSESFEEMFPKKKEEYIIK